MSVRRTSMVVVLGVVAIVAALLVSSGAFSAQAAPAAQTGATQPVSRTITVVGRGEIKVKPDVATTTVGVESLGPTVEAAMDDAHARMTSVIAALKKLGIADKDIQTNNFSISFERQGSPEPKPAAQATPGAFEPPAGFYRVSNMVQVTIRDLTKVSDVIDTAVKAGANNVWGISFGLDDTKSLEAQARESAVADAKARAESLAALTGVKVGPVVAVSEILGNQPMPVYAAADKMGLGGGGTQTEPGEVSFATQIQIVYGIQ